jgi:tRNA pseudouridine55 synthase
VAEPDGLLLLDKPAGFSSTQAMARAKRLLGSRKAGHTGTLDPFATGLLPIAFGEATKFSRFLLDSIKSYRATLQLGMESTTGDTEGDVVHSGTFSGDQCRIDEVLASFVGVQEQVPPMHSAVRINGRRLYDLAREGKEVPRAARRVEVVAIQPVSLDGDALVLDVTCSKGTYVRVLATDIGRALGCGAYLRALRRVAVGTFRDSQAFTLQVLEAAGVEGSRSKLLPLEVMVAGIPSHAGSADEALRFSQGQEILLPQAAAGSEVAVFGPGHSFVGVGRCQQAGKLAPLRLLATTPKFPDFA